MLRAAHANCAETVWQRGRIDEHHRVKEWRKRIERLQVVLTNNKAAGAQYARHVNCPRTTLL